MDELFSNANNVRKKKEKKQRTKIIIISIIIVLVSLSLTLFHIFRNNNFGSGKEIVLKNLNNMKLSEYTDFNEMAKAISKENTTPVEITSDVNFYEETENTQKESTNSNMPQDAQNNANKNNSNNNQAMMVQSNPNNTGSTFNNIAISDLLFSSRAKLDGNNNSTGEITLDIKYKDNNIFSLTFVDDGEVMSIYEPSYFAEAIGIRKENIADLANNILPNEGETLEKELERNEIIENLTMLNTNTGELNFANELVQIADIYQKNYIAELSKLPEEKFTLKKNVPTEYREKEVRADNVTLELTKEEYSNIMLNAKNNTKAEIYERKNDFATLSFLTTTRNTSLGSVLNKYVLPIENIGIEMFFSDDGKNTNLENMQGSGDISNNTQGNNVGNITLINENEETQDVDTNNYNSQEVVGDVVGNENNIENNEQTGQGTDESLEYNYTEAGSGFESENIDLNEKIYLNYYIIAGEDLKIDRVEKDTVVSTFELYNNDKGKEISEIIYGYILDGKERKYKLTKTEDDGTVYNILDIQDIIGEEILNSVSSELSRSKNIEAANNNITYKMNKKTGNMLRGSNISKNVKYVDKVEFANDKKVTILNDLPADSLNNIMINIIYPQIIKVTSEKILFMENLLSVTKENNITGTETEPADPKNMMDETENIQSNIQGQVTNNVTGNMAGQVNNQNMDTVNQ